ncbi:MAG: hypothetical protein ABFC65_01920 [Rectinema sp.]
MVDTRMTFAANFVKNLDIIRSSDVDLAMVRRIVSSLIIIIATLLLTLGLLGSSVV